MKRLLLLLMLLSQAAFGAVAYDHSTACASDPNNVTSVQCTLSSTSTGNLSFVVVQNPSQTETTTTITDSAGNNYTPICSNTSDYPFLWAYYARNVSPGITWVRATVTTSVRMVVWHVDVSGADQTAPLDFGVCGNTGYVSSPFWTSTYISPGGYASTSQTTAEANELLITVGGQYYQQTAGVWSAGTVKAGGASYTMPVKRDGGTNVYNQGALEYYFASAVDSYRGNAFWSITSGEKLSWVFVAFKSGVFKIPHRGQVY